MVVTYAAARVRRYAPESADSDVIDAEWWGTADPSAEVVASAPFDESLAMVCAEARGAAEFIEELCSGGSEAREIREGIRTFIVKAGASRTGALALLGLLDRELELTSDLLGQASGRSSGLLSRASEPAVGPVGAVLIDWKAVNEAASSTPLARILDEDGAVLTSVKLSAPANWPSEDIDC